MNSQIRALHRLQASDHKMVNLERRLIDIPRRLKELDEDLSTLEQMLIAERSKLEETRDFKRGQEMQLRDEEDHIRASKTRLGSVSTPRELNATQREIDTTRRLATARAEEIVKIEGAIDETETRISTMETGLGDLQKQATVERDRLEKEKTKLEVTLGATREAREKLLADVDEPLQRTYERVRSRTGGVGFVAARDRKCTACKMAIPHSQYVTLKKGDEIVPCETCGRLLYWSGHFPDKKPAEPKPKAAPPA